jgi:hypothetical protein
MACGLYLLWKTALKKSARKFKRRNLKRYTFESMIGYLESNKKVRRTETSTPQNSINTNWANSSTSEHCLTD